MVRMMRWMGVALLALCTVGCNQDALVAKFAPHPQSEIAKKALDDWHAGRNDALRAEMDPAFRDQASDSALTRMTDQLPKGEPDESKLVGSKFFSRDGQTRYDITYEYRFADRRMLGTATLMTRDGKTAVVGLHAWMISAEQEQAGTLTLKGKGPGQLAMLFLAMAVPVFCLTVFVICVRTPKFRWKRTWAFFTLVGVVTLRMNWATGGIRLDPLSFQIFGASATTDGYNPWIIGISFPLGAVLFLLRRRRLPPKVPTETV
jgi:hypothetical protein